MFCIFHNLLMALSSDLVILSRFKCIRVMCFYLFLVVCAVNCIEFQTLADSSIYPLGFFISS